MRKLATTFLFVFTLSSCNLIDYNSLDGDTFDISGTWRLVGGSRYELGYSNNEIIRITDHFIHGDSSNLSILGSDYQIDAIYLDSTTWSFEPDGHDGRFWLDYPSNDPYTLDLFRTYLGNNNWFETWGVYSYPEIGATKVVIQLESGVGNHLTIKVGETSQSIGNVNEKTYSILEFEKVASW
jgi:hypothetical protein